MSQELILNTNTSEQSRLFAGWFGRNLGWIAAAAALICPVLGGVLGALAIANGGARTPLEIDDPRALYEPTLSEQAILDKNKVDIKNIIADIGNKLYKKFLDETNVMIKYDLANQISYRGDFMLWYYKNYELAGLSQAAIDQRAYTIEELMNKIYIDVDNKMFELGFIHEEATYIYPAWSQITDLYPKTFIPIEKEITYPSWVYMRPEAGVPVDNQPRDTTPIPKPTEGYYEVPATPIPLETMETTTNLPTTDTINDCQPKETKFYQKGWFWFLAGIVTKKVLD